MSKLVSILMPAFNAEEWIADSLRSAIGQTWGHIEVIVVDDGSRDQTLAIARRFESPSVRVMTQKNQGAAAARNLAFSMSQGDYIQWLDADDLLAPDKIALQMQVLAESDGRTLASCPWGAFRYRLHEALFRPTSLWSDLSPTEWLIRKMAENLHMQPGTWLTPREVAIDAGLWDTSLTNDDDGEYFCRVLMRSNGVRFVPDGKVYYRQTGSGLSFIGRGRKLDPQWRSMQLHIGYLRSMEDSARVRSACVRYLQNWMTFFYPERLDIFHLAEKLARDLDGQLHVPELGWKYAWIERLGGRLLAKRAQVSLPAFKARMRRNWDKLLFRMEQQRATDTVKGSGGGQTLPGFHRTGRISHF